MRLNQPKNYALITGILLFLVGFLGFAFPTSINLPGGYLLAGLVLGFWGIIIGAGAPKN